MIIFLLVILSIWWIAITIGFWFGLFIGLLYAKSYYDNSENTAVREWSAFRNMKLWYWIKKYFSFRIEYQNKESILSTRNYIYGLSTHGVLNFSHVLGCAVTGGDSIHPHGHIQPMSHTVLFWIPFIRDICLWAGAINATKENYRTFLCKKGKSVSVVPGGIREMLLCNREEALIFKGHKGFLRMALECDADLIPVFAKGENKIMWPLPWLFPRIRKRFIRKIEWYEEEKNLNQTRTRLICTLGILTWLAVLGPFPEKLTLIVGTPIQIDQKKDTVESLHTKFYSEMDLLRLESA